MRRILLVVCTAVVAAAATLLPIGTGTVAHAAVPGTARAVTAAAPAPMVQSIPNVSPTGQPAIIWEPDHSSYYVQRWVLQHPGYAAGQQKARDFTSKAACTLLLASKGPTKIHVRPDKKDGLPAWLKKELGSEVGQEGCERALSWFFANLPPASAFPKAKAQNACLRIDFGVVFWQAPDHNRNFCLPPDRPRIVMPVNEPPVARFTYTRKAGPGNVVVLNGTSSTDPENRIEQYQWTSGREVLGYGPHLTVAMGTRRSVTLHVRDHRKSSAALTRSLVLGNQAPVIHSMSPGHNGVVGTNKPTLKASAGDADGDALQFHHQVSGPYVSLDSGWVPGSWTVPPHKLDPGTRYSWTVTVRDPRGATATRTSEFSVAMLPTANDIVSTSSGAGYWQVASDGGVFAYGNAGFHGSLPGLGVRVNNVFGMARTPTDGGYWLVGRDGGVYAFGDAGFHHSLPSYNIRVDNIVGMAPTKDGRGYWLVGADGGVFAFGSAQFHGSMGGRPLNAPIEGMAVTASGNGYWLVARDGGVFAFGDAPYHGGMGGHALNSPVVDIDVTPDGGGYYLTAEDGGVFTYGNARFHGSMGGRPLQGRVTSMGVTHDGGGYWLSACDGGVFAFGNAPFAGSRPVYECRGVG